MNAMASQVTKKEGFLLDRKYRKIAFQSWLPETASLQLVMLHGFAEHLRKYEIMAQKLAAAGVAVHLMDLPGHGLSAGNRGHIDDFREYLENLDWFLKANPHHLAEPATFLFGHSMGGLIASLFCIEQNPKLNGLILSSPLTGFDFLKSLPSKLLAHYLYRKNPDQLFPKPFGFETLCRDPDKWRQYTEDPLRVHTISPNLYLSMFEYCTLLQEKAVGLTLPLLVFNTTQDQVVSTKAILNFFKKAASTDKTMVVFTRAMHELAQEQEETQMTANLLAWMQSRI